MIPVVLGGTDVVSSCLIPRLRAEGSMFQGIRADKGDGWSLGSRLTDLQLLSMLLVVHCL